MGRPITDALGPQDDGETELTPEERQGLLLSYVTVRRELNEAEQANIVEGTARARRRVFAFDEAYLNRLHRDMFGAVWEWAGTVRTTDKNIGVPFYRIAADLRQLLDDCRYWTQHNTYEPDELATRFHHRLVYIHPYSNGNGRHSRLAADFFLESSGRPPFTWGRVTNPEMARDRYLAALHAADAHDIAPLLAFVRS